MVRIRVWSKAGRTESAERVRAAVENLFPGVELKGNGQLEAELGPEDLRLIQRLIAVRKIGKTVRSQLLKNLRDGKTKLMFNKQAAFAGKLSLVEEYDESPMGAVVLEMDWDDGMVEWLTGLSRNQERKRNRQKGP